MTPEEIEAVAHRWHLEVVQENKLELADEILTPDVVVHFNGPEFRGAEAAKGLVAAARGAFPDIRFTHHEAIVSGDRAAIRWTFEATHRGDYLGIPASGQRLHFEGLDFFHFRGGRIAEVWIEFDNLGPFQQAGVLGRQEGDRAMSAEANKELVRRFIDAVNRHDLASFDALFAPDFVPRDTVVPVPPGPEGVRGLFAAVLRAFPDMHETLDDLIAEGDKVLMRWTVRATHRGAFAGVAPTGKAVTWKGMAVLRVVNGQFVEIWQVHDQLALLQQLGALPQAQPLTA